MMVIHITEELEGFLRDAVGSGRYASVDSVISDALTRLQQSFKPSDANFERGTEPCQPGKQLTKQEFQRHLVDIGLLDESRASAGESDKSDQSLIDEEGEIVSEVVIRERLIEWLAGFLEK